MLAFALSAAEFEVVAIEDHSEAFRRAWAIHPDIIVADLPMPSERWQFLESLKQSPRTRDIPIVAMSGDIQRSVQEGIEREGLAAFFPKPCLPDELAAALRQVLDRYTYIRVRQ